MIRSKDELMQLIRDRIGDDTSDEAIAFIEDISDSLNDYENKVSGYNELEEKYKENDKAWREKYKNAFFNGSKEKPEEPEQIEEEESKKRLTYEDLFKEE